MIRYSTLVAFVANNVDVSLHTPASSPTVLHDPIIQTGCKVMSVSNDKNSVVGSSGTVRRVEDTAIVKLNLRIALMETYSGPIVAVCIFRFLSLPFNATSTYVDILKPTLDPL